MDPVGCTIINEGLGELLLPGILDQITLDKITPMLSWRDVHNLTSVSRGWYHAIRSRKVYEARVRARSRETLVLVNYTISDKVTITLYSMRERCGYQLPLPPSQLPSWPHPYSELPPNCQCVSLDGKLYVLGGCYAAEVYVLDLAGEMKWTKCARMQKERENFGCAVIGGKIYVFGGETAFGIVYGAEVYDPKYDAWSPIMPMRSLRFQHHVATLGEELVLFGGRVLDPLQFDWTEQRMLDPNDKDLWLSAHVNDADTLEFYHPVKDEWRVVNCPGFFGIPLGIAFTAQGDLYLLEELGIEIYDVNKNSWRIVHSSSFPEAGPDCTHLAPKAVVAVGDELVAVVERGGSYAMFSNIYHCKGLGSDDRVMVWEDSPFGPLPRERFEEGFLDEHTYFMCTIQL